MYMQEAPEAVCKKWKLNLNGRTLLVRDASVLIFLDSTVAVLEPIRMVSLFLRNFLLHEGFT